MPRATVVAIPLRDEAKRIGGCLAALSRQTVPADHVVLLLNNCRDGTAEVVKASPKASHRLHVVECELEGSSASAGVARGLAMNHSASLIDDGVILTTDADAEVPENWIEANLRAIEEGSDAVCGKAVSTRSKPCSSRAIYTRMMLTKWPTGGCLTRSDRSSFRILQTRGHATAKTLAPALP